MNIIYKYYLYIYKIKLKKQHNNCDKFFIPKRFLWLVIMILTVLKIYKNKYKFIYTKIIDSSTICKINC